MAGEKIDRAGGPFRSYSWRQAMMRDKSISSHGKHVLHVLDAHFNPAGDPAYPKIVTIARRASLSERAVKKHLKPLIGVWVHVERRRFTDEHGRTTTRYHYLPRYPEGLIDFEADDGSGAPRARAPRAPAQNKEPIKKNKTSPNPISGEMGDWFEELFKAYPKKSAKDRAWKTVQRINPDADTRAKIIEGLDRWKKIHPSAEAPFLSSWLRGQYWRDALQSRIPWTCSTCGKSAAVGDGRDYWCDSHDPDRRREDAP